MRRGIALWLSALLLWASVLPVSADGFFNDDRFDWGEYACSHTHTERVEAVASTCTEQGHAAYLRCVECRLVVEGSDEPLPLAEHVYDNACDATCNACDVVREVGAHDYVPLSAEPPTCEADGFERFYCTLCGDVYTDTIPSEGHRYDAVVTAPDCENSGYTVHTCTVCGDSYADSRVEALGHSYRVTETAPTCVDDGKKVYVCAACGDSYTVVIPATGRHTYAYMCDEVCDVCGYVRNDAHVYTHMGTIEPTCGEDGSEGYKCWECGKCEYVIIPATGKHTYSGACDAECNVCGQIRESVETHQYVLTEEIAVTCTIDGKKVYTCTNCGDSYTEIIPSEGHKYGIVITPPTCEQGGYTTYTCSVCGDTQVDNRTDALGHAYDDAFDATCNVCGAEREAAVRGDVDGNGKVNNRDLGLLQKHLNGSAVDIAEAAADLDGNGKVNNRDLGLLQKLLNR